MGLVLLPHSRLDAYMWFDRGILVGILVTQVFVFDKEQLAGVVGLTISIVIWVLVRGAIRAERERTVGEEGGGEAAIVSANPSPTPKPAS